MTDLKITKDDIGKVFVRRDGVEATVLAYRPRISQFLARGAKDPAVYSYCVNGREQPDEEGNRDLIKRKEETMWIEHDGKNPNLPDWTIVEARFKTGETRVGYSWEFGWTITQPERYVVKEYRIVEAAPEEKPEPKRWELGGKKIEVTEEMLCAAIDAHRNYRYENYGGRKAFIDGVDGFGAWRAALQAALAITKGDEGEGL